MKYASDKSNDFDGKFKQRFLLGAEAWIYKEQKRSKIFAIFK